LREGMQSRRGEKQGLRSKVKGQKARRLSSLEVRRDGPPVVGRVNTPAASGRTAYRAPPSPHSLRSIASINPLPKPIVAVQNGLRGATRDETTTTTAFIPLPGTTPLVPGACLTRASFIYNSKSLVLPPTLPFRRPRHTVHAQHGSRSTFYCSLWATQASPDTRRQDKIPPKTINKNTPRREKSHPA